MVERACVLAFAALPRCDRDKLVRIAADETGARSLLDLAIERGRKLAMTHAVVGLEAALVQQEVSNQL